MNPDVIFLVPAIAVPFGIALSLGLDLWRTRGEADQFAEQARQSIDEIERGLWVSHEDVVAEFEGRATNV